MCNSQKLSGITSLHSVFFQEELLEASRKIYVFAPHQFRKTFAGFPESVGTLFTEDTRTDSEIRCL